MDITKNKDFVETFVNQTGQNSLIFKSVTPDKRLFTVKHKTRLILNLQDVNGDQIPADSLVYFAGKRIVPVFPNKVLDDKVYTPYKEVIENDGFGALYNEENRNSIILEFDQAKYDFPEGHNIQIWLDSDTQIDWSNSYVEFKAEEKPYRD